MKNAVKVLIFTLVILIAAGGSLYFYINYNTSDFEYVSGTKSGTVEITSYIGSDKDIVIPEKIKGDTVTSIGESAFSNADITSVEIPDTVTLIGEKAFAMCKSLESVKMSANVQKINEGAFFQCYKLKSITLPETLTEMEGAVFYECGELVLDLADGANFVYEDEVLFDKDKTTAYWVNPDKDLSNYKFPETVTTLKPYLLGGHEELKTFTLPEKLTVVPNCLFISCQNLESLVIHDGVKKIENTVFLGCMNMKSVIVPASVGEIGTGNFPVKDADEMKDFVLKVYDDSSAMFYAQENNINYEIIK